MYKKKNNKFSKKSIILCIVMLLMLLFIFFSIILKKDRSLNPIEIFLRDSISYTEKIITSPFRFVINKFNDFKDLINVKKENDLLKTSLDRIESIETENMELRRQLEKLKKEVNIDYSLTDYKYLNASIINRNVGFWFNTFTINKGTYSGVEKDMVVINRKGLVGKIIRTTTFTSDVRLLTTSDTNNKISVTIKNDNNNLFGVINGFDYKNNKLIVEGISNTKDVKIGDIVYTSGLGGIFPSGILIGKVSDISTDSYDLGKIIKVTPSVDFNDMNYVTILKRKDN